MTDLSELSAEELQELAKLQFSMLAETWAALTVKEPESRIAKMSAYVARVEVGVAIIGRRDFHEATP